MLTSDYRQYFNDFPGIINPPNFVYLLVNPGFLSPPLKFLWSIALRPPIRRTPLTDTVCGVWLLRRLHIYGYLPSSGAHHRPSTSTNLYCLVTEAGVRERLVQGRIRQRSGWDSNPPPLLYHYGYRQLMWSAENPPKVAFQ